MTFKGTRCKSYGSNWYPTMMECAPAGIGPHLSTSAPPAPNRQPLLRPTRDHTICVEVCSVDSGQILPFTIPHPENIWSSEHVKMPFSTYQMQTMTTPGRHGQGREVPHWEVVKEMLNKPDFRTVRDLETAIMRYNPKYVGVWHFVGLHHFLNQMHGSEQQYILGKLLPQMAQLALKLPTLCQKPIPLLRVGMNHAITMSQEQIACLLANAFFCTFSHHFTTCHHSKYSSFPDINFNRLFEKASHRTSEKLKTIFCYFSTVVENMPKGLVTFQRCGLNKPIDWKRSQCKITQLYITSEGTIEDEGRGLLQVDFASSLVGGGVLGQGLVQEEIRFLINTELIVTRLFTERLNANECLVITGAQRYSDYTGYSDSYRWIRSHNDMTPRDSWLRRLTEIVAIDATQFSNPNDQYRPHYLERELMKAYCGFSHRVIPENEHAAVATGNWGCGAYKGDIKLKALIQVMAASQARRDVVYFTFGSNDSCEAIHKMHQCLQKRNVTVGQIYNLLEKYSRTDFSKSRAQNLYDFIQNNLDYLRGRF
ncbi:poly(ADP-ribose) glycohydrolase-like [Narcine bancroftii]|uniref:poly(ADP-ribose) glycohydrolase-like n=1 Tax=Narcine bancroftii TaxID=1343680 RepID=UPI003831B737